MSEVIPHKNDVLLGRGGKNNQHSGNENLRVMAREVWESYRDSTKKGKSDIARRLVQQMKQLEPPARFLRRSEETGTWEETTDEIARSKASQVLRDAVAAYETETFREAPEVSHTNTDRDDKPAARLPSILEQPTLSTSKSDSSSSFSALGSPLSFNFAPSQPPPRDPSTRKRRRYSEVVQPHPPKAPYDPVRRQTEPSTGSEAFASYPVSGSYDFEASHPPTQSPYATTYGVQHPHDSQVAHGAMLAHPGGLIAQNIPPFASSVQNQPTRTAAVHRSVTERHVEYKHDVAEPQVPLAPTEESAAARPLLGIPQESAMELLQGALLESDLDDQTHEDDSPNSHHRDTSFQ